MNKDFRKRASLDKFLFVTQKHRRKLPRIIRETSLSF